MCTLNSTQGQQKCTLNSTQGQQKCTLNYNTRSTKQLLTDGWLINRVIK